MSSPTSRATSHSTVIAAMTINVYCHRYSPVVRFQLVPTQFASWQVLPLQARCCWNPFLGSLGKGFRGLWHYSFGALWRANLRSSSAPAGVFGGATSELFGQSYVAAWPQGSVVNHCGWLCCLHVFVVVSPPNTHGIEHSPTQTTAQRQRTNSKHSLSSLTNLPDKIIKIHDCTILSGE